MHRPRVLLRLTVYMPAARAGTCLTRSTTCTRGPPASRQTAAARRWRSPRAGMRRVGVPSTSLVHTQGS